ncbi:MAG: hypothetical protein ACE5J0_01730 [Candidatus Paceibacterales bacterium]
MNPLKDPRTNWRYILIVVILGVIVGGGIFVYQQEQETFREEVFIVQLPQKEKPGEIEITGAIVDKIVGSILPENFDKENAEFFIEDFNKDGLQEIIISATPVVAQGESPREAYIVVVTPTDEAGSYEKIADFSFGEEENIWFRGVPNINGSDYVLDIDRDGKKEIVLDLGTGGASNEAYGIFKIDWDLNKINWLKVRREDGSVENTFFLQGGSVMHQEFFQLKDINNDGALEIIEKMSQYIGDSGKPEDWQKEENWKWQIWVYKWDGSIFIYDKELSDLENETANWKTYRNEKYES